MKKLKLIFMLCLGLAGMNSIKAQNLEMAPDSLGLPGDNFNLSAVLEIFQQSQTLEDFERALNTEDKKVNNLDLNRDNKTDYIKVIDNMQGNAHAIVLQTPINPTENQDIAVIMVDKDVQGEISVQIIGDEDLYGKNYIIEPLDENASKEISSKSSTPNPGYKPSKTDTSVGSDGKTVIINNYYTTTNNTTNNTTTNSNNTTSTNSNSNGNYGYNQPVTTASYVRVSYWPMWGFLFAPSYVVYVSPYHYAYYPGWYNPWAPVYFHTYYWGHYNHYNYYRYHHHYHNQSYHNHYYNNNRSRSNTVYQARNTGAYKKTYEQPNRKPIAGNSVNSRPNPGYSNKADGMNSRPNTQPATRPSVSPNSRPAAPATGTTRPQSPSNQNPNYRPSPSNPSPSPSNRPITPSTNSPDRQPSYSKPAVQPSTPSNNSPSRQPSYNKPATQPSVNPAPSQNRPSSGGARPSAPSARPSGGAARPAGGGGSPRMR
jgi:hypothetical protein